MKTNALLFLLLCLYFPLRSQAQTSVPRKFSVAELQEDFAYWRRRLEHKHPLLYMHCTQDSVNRCFDRIYSAINRPMTELEFFRLISPVTAVVKDGHNAIILSKSGMDSVLQSKYLLPIAVKVIQGKLYIARPVAGAPALAPGMELKEIDGVAADRILDTILSGLRREGEREPFALAQIEDAFRFYYFVHFGMRPAYLVACREKSGALVQCTVKGVNLETLKAQTSASGVPSKPFALRLQHLDTLNTAIITIRTFDATALKDTYRQNFNKEISRYFNEIQAYGTKNIILDLRGNPGGNPNFVKFFLRHVMNCPFRQALQCRIVRNSRREIFSARTRKMWFPWYGLGRFRPVRRPFTGNIYVLINGGTFSAGTILAGVLHRCRRAVFIGTETGGNPAIMGGYLIKTTWELPNSRIQVLPATLCTLYAEPGANTGTGVMPDYPIVQRPEDLGKTSDDYLTKALELIRTKHQH
jgi:hypothetical protein